MPMRKPVVGEAPLSKHDAKSVRRRSLGVSRESVLRRRAQDLAAFRRFAEVLAYLEAPKELRVHSRQARHNGLSESTKVGFGDQYDPRRPRALPARLVVSSQDPGPLPDQTLDTTIVGSRERAPNVQLDVGSQRD